MIDFDFDALNPQRSLFFVPLDGQYVQGGLQVTRSLGKQLSVDHAIMGDGTTPATIPDQLPGKRGISLSGSQYIQMVTGSTLTEYSLLMYGTDTIEYFNPTVIGLTYDGDMLRNYVNGEINAEQSGVVFPLSSPIVLSAASVLFPPLSKLYLTAVYSIEFSQTQVREWGRRARQLRNI